MYITIHLTGWSIAILIYAFWWGFLGASALYSQWHTGTLTLWVKALATPGGLVFSLVDVVLNYTLCTVFFMELPPSGCYTLTKRLTAYLSESGGRSKVAYYICHYILNPFQIGGHCVK